MVYGVDGCRGGWLVVSFSNRSGFESAFPVGSFAEVVEQTQDGNLVLIDIPIGLPDAKHPTRSCDQEARRLLGQRRSSVFPAPARAALGATTYSETCRLNRGALGKGLSRQTWGICKKITEVDRVLWSQPELRLRYREAHPEVCFAALNSWQPMKENKRHPLGQKQRLNVLTKHARNSADFFERTRNTWPRSKVDLTDMLDAMVLAIVSCEALSRNCPTLPVNPPADDLGLSMEIVCPRPPRPE